MIEIPDLDCRKHPAMALIVTVSWDGEVAFHSHCTKARTAATLGQFVDQLRAELLTEAATGADLP